MGRSISKKRAYNKMWAEENPDKMRESNRKYYSKPENKARQKAYYAERREETRQRSREWCTANRDKVLAAKRRYYERNKEQLQAKARAKKETDPETARAKRRAWWAKRYARERDKLLAQAHRYKARLRDASSPGVSVSEWADIKETFCGLCAYCLKPCPMPHREHVIALARGGMDEPGNVVPACGPCNWRKRDLTLLDWARISIR